MAIFFINVISHSKSEVTVSYSTVAVSVAVFLGIPLGAAIITRFALQRIASPDWYDRIFLKYLSPWSLIGLLYTILVLFASQGRQVVHQIVSVVRVAAPLFVYFVTIFFITLLVSHRLGFGYKLSATQSFTAACDCCRGSNIWARQRSGARFYRRAVDRSSGTAGPSISGEVVGQAAWVETVMVAALGRHPLLVAKWPWDAPCTRHLFRDIIIVTCFATHSTR